MSFFFNLILIGIYNGNYTCSRNKLCHIFLPGWWHLPYLTAAVRGWETRTVAGEWHQIKLNAHALVYQHKAMQMHLLGMNDLSRSHFDVFLLHMADMVNKSVHWFLFMIPLHLSVWRGSLRSLNFKSFPFPFVFPFLFPLPFHKCCFTSICPNDFVSKKYFCLWIQAKYWK